MVLNKTKSLYLRLTFKPVKELIQLVFDGGGERSER
jgi:hypothetical protein